MLNIEDALIMRAEYCEGHISYNEMTNQMPEYQLVPIIRTIADVCGGVTRWINNPEVAMWESLLTMAVVTYEENETV